MKEPRRKAAAMESAQKSKGKNKETPSSNQMSTPPGMDRRASSAAVQVSGAGEAPPHDTTTTSTNGQVEELRLNGSGSKPPKPSNSNKNKTQRAAAVAGMAATQMGAQWHWGNFYQQSSASYEAVRDRMGDRGNRIAIVGGVGNGSGPEPGTDRPIQEFNQHAQEKNPDWRTRMEGLRTADVSSTAQFQARNASKGKEVVQDSAQCHNVNAVEAALAAAAAAAEVAVAPVPRSGRSLDLGLNMSQPGPSNVDAAGSVSASNGVLLSDWLKPGRKVDRNQSVRIFRQILDYVDAAHSRNISLRNIRPSCFNLLPSDKLIFVGTVTRNDTGEVITNTGGSSSRKRSPADDLSPTSCPKRQKLAANTSVARDQEQTSNRSGDMLEAPTDDFQMDDLSYPRRAESDKASDIYCLGVLLFELFSSFESCQDHTDAMLSLHRRILPPNFLREHFKEAGFCLWLLHPEPTSRPTARQIKNSRIIREVGDDQSVSLTEDPADAELLEYFLLCLFDGKQKQADKLEAELRVIDADIEDILRRRPNAMEPSREDPARELAPCQAKLQNNIDKLADVYFSARPRVNEDTGQTRRRETDLLQSRERWSVFPNANENAANAEPENPREDFFKGLCKYARYDRFEVRGQLGPGSFYNQSNVICSLGFDRDEEYFAAAGVSKTIKIFDFDRFLNSSVDVHYPEVELNSKSKISCVDWNSYIKNMLAATDYDGVVQLWDVGTAQESARYTDHSKRTWSVHFSPVDPTRFASGGDDCSVKQWTITEPSCISSIQTRANICCVQYSSESSNLLAVGSADYRITCYDLRYTRVPWCTLPGHQRAVSYVRFMDAATLVSASTDSTIKVWDLNKTTSNGLSPEACSVTCRGHSNNRSFVGMSVSGDYIACGSESNEVFAYHKSLSIPITTHKFGTIDPASGEETYDDRSQFVSSVCWKRNSDMVVAGNSVGRIKILQIK